MSEFTILILDLTISPFLWVSVSCIFELLYNCTIFVIYWPFNNPEASSFMTDDVLVLKSERTANSQITWCSLPVQALVLPDLCLLFPKPPRTPPPAVIPTHVQLQPSGDLESLCLDSVSQPCCNFLMSRTSLLNLWLLCQPWTQSF